MHWSLPFKFTVPVAVKVKGPSFCGKLQVEIIKENLTENSDYDFKEKNI